MRDTSSIQSVERAVEVLLCLADGRGALSLDGISEHLGYNRTSIHRMLVALSKRGFVDRDPVTQRYGLGRLIPELCRARSHQVNLASRALDHMRRLRERTGETISLHVRVGAFHRAAEQLESPQELRRVVDVSALYPIHSGASGKVLLAFLPEAALEGLVQPLGKAEVWALRRELEAIRAAGFAVSRAELVGGAVAVSAPVRDAHGQVIAALSVTGPESRLHDDALQQATEHVLRAAEELSLDLGHDAPLPWGQSGADAKTHAVPAGEHQMTVG